MQSEKKRKDAALKPDPEELIDDFLEYLFQIRGYSEHTVSTYETVLRQMLESCRWREDKGQIVMDITPLRLAILHNSKKTIAKKLSAVRSFFVYIQEQREIPVRLTGDTPVKVPHTLPKPVENRYIEEVMGDADPTERTILAMLYGLGLRISELATLRREDISGEWVIVHGKGGKSRQLPMFPYLQEILRDYMRRYPAGKYLFEKGGAPMNAAQLRYRVEKIFKKHGIKATPHQLRHSFATHLLDNGARISDVSELLGHASMATTQIYTKLANSKKLQEYMHAHPLARDEHL
jgi:integrase/recombinase XerC